MAPHLLEMLAQVPDYFKARNKRHLPLRHIGTLNCGIDGGYRNYSASAEAEGGRLELIVINSLQCLLYFGSKHLFQF